MLIPLRAADWIEDAAAGGVRAELGAVAGRCVVLAEGWDAGAAAAVAPTGEARG